jgi:hypothetical protein
VLIADLYLRGLLKLPAEMPAPRLDVSYGPDLIALAIIAKTMHGMPVGDDVSLLASLGTPLGDGLRWPAGRREFFGSSDASTALALRAFVAAGNESLARQATLTLARDRKNYYWSNTFATAQALEALVRYSKVYRQEPTAPLPYTVTMNGVTLATGILTNQYDSRTVLAPVPAGTSTAHITLESTASTSLFTTGRFSLFRTERNLPTLDNGISLYRSYDGEFTPGSTVTVTIIASGEASDGEALVIEDFLPAGLIPVNTRLDNEREGDQRRVDRYYTEEFKPDGVVAATEFWNGETIVYTYRARVVSRGDYTAPPAVASLMYRPEVTGRSQTHVIRVTDRSEESGVIFNSDPDHSIALPPSDEVSRFGSLPGTSPLSVIYLSTLLVALAVIAIVALSIWYRRRLDTKAAAEAAASTPTTHDTLPPTT